MELFGWQIPGSQRLRQAALWQPGRARLDMLLGHAMAVVMGAQASSATSTT